MRMTLYYMVHTVKNQIRKLFRTWVAVFLLICLLIGVIFGLGAAALSTLFEEDVPEDEEHYEEVMPDDSTTPEELPTPAEIAAILELGVGALVLAVIFFSAFQADKSGSSIFLMADVNLLFQAPLSPQAVLLFRLLMQAGTSAFATVYLVFQIPNLMLNLELGLGMVLVILAAWFFLLVYSKLISVLLYTVCSTKPMLKKRLRPTLFVLIAIIGGAFLLFSKRFEGDTFLALQAFFNAPLTRLIPVWGWMKALLVFAYWGHWGRAAVALLALALFAVLLILIIRRVKADFYEEAMARSEEIAALREAQQNAKGLKQRKKERGERVRGERPLKGYAATVYFYKTLHSRFRFAYLHVFTKTSLTYLLVAIGTVAFLLLTVKSSFFPAVALVLAGFSFFRALGNPIAADIAQEHFYMIPDTAHRKVLFSFLGGILNALLDVLPAFLLAALFLRANPLSVLLWLLLIISVGAFCDSMGLFIDLSLRESLTPIVKSLIQILFVYFGLAPTAILIVLGFAFDLLLPFVGIAIALNLVITALSLSLSPLFIINGKK
ncbi:MAG: hypothetical protein E7639_02405 [Ruminococcaceae bacterium]|nr:hypothetical protein [Oscillospiraceae bacterium]